MPQYYNCGIISDYTREVLLMTKRILALVLSGVMILSTGCGLSSGTKDKLFGDSDITDIVENAVKTGNFELLDEYFEADKISQDLLNECLNVAVFADDPYESILYLLEKGADPNNDNIIWDLAYNARAEAMRALLTSDNVDLNKKNEVGHDALYMALENEGGGSEYGNYQVTKLLIEAGAEPYPELFANTKEDKRESPYKQLLASPYSSKFLLEKLLEAGEESGLPKACELVILGESEEAVEECSKNSNDYNEDDVTLLTTFLAYWGTPEQCETVCSIYNTQIYSGMLQRVVQTNNEEMLDYIVKTNEIDLTDKSEAGLLQRAANFDNYEACKYLCDNNVYMIVNDVGEASGLYQLKSAALYDDLELFKLLYDYANSRGARITEEYLAESLGTSLSCDNKDIIDFLSAEGYTFSAIDISDSDLESVKYFEECGKILDGIDLINAVKGGDVEVVKYILDKNIDVNAIGEYESTPLSTALSGKYEILKLIIENGADIPENILENAVYASKKNVKLLIDSGAKTELKFDKIKVKDGSYKSGDYDLKDYWETYGRNDLVELL